MLTHFPTLYWMTILIMKDSLNVWRGHLLYILTFPIVILYNNKIQLELKITAVYLQYTHLRLNLKHFLSECFRNTNNWFSFWCTLVSCIELFSSVLHYYCEQWTTLTHQNVSTCACRQHQHHYWRMMCEVDGGDQCVVLKIHIVDAFENSDDKICK